MSTIINQINGSLYIESADNNGMLAFEPSRMTSMTSNTDIYILTDDLHMVTFSDNLVRVLADPSCFATVSPGQLSVWIIIIGCIACLILIAALVIILWFALSKKKNQIDNEETMNNDK